MVEPPIATIFTMRCSTARRAAHGLGSRTARCHHDERYDKLILALRGLSPFGQLQHAEEVNLATLDQILVATATPWARRQRPSGEGALADACFITEIAPRGWRKSQALLAAVHADVDRSARRTRRCTSLRSMVNAQVAPVADIAARPRPPGQASYVLALHCGSEYVVEVGTANQAE